MAPNPQMQAAAERRLSGSKGMFSSIRRRRKPSLPSAIGTRKPSGSGYTRA